jgi:hypothetical protein
MMSVVVVEEKYAPADGVTRERLERDQEKWIPVFRPIPLQT